jgi:hypothetical protein
MNNDQLCDPLNILRKQINPIQSLRKKTDSHHYALSRLGWEGKLFYDHKIGIFIPSKIIMGCFRAGAKKNKLGAKIISIFLECAPGPSIIGLEKYTPEKLWQVKNKHDEPLYLFRDSVVINKQRIMNSRPIFTEWEIKFNLTIDEHLEEDELLLIIKTAGHYCGMGDLRPQKGTGTYGRFELKDMKKI